MWGTTHAPAMRSALGWTLGTKELAQKHAVYEGQCDRARGPGSKSPEVTDTVCHTSQTQGVSSFSPNGRLSSSLHLDCGRLLSLPSPAHGQRAVTECSCRSHQ